MAQHQDEALLAQLVALLREEFGDDLLGILVTGSRVHGRPDPTSDLDAHVIVAVPRRQRRNFVLDGVEVELFINPPFQNRRYFADARGVDQHMFTFGRAAYDPRGVVADLQAEARRLWEAGPPPWDARLAWQDRYFPADLLRDLDDVGDTDEATAALLLAAIVDRLLATHDQRNRRWPAKPKRWLAELAEWDPEAARLARAALACGPLSQRRLAVERLAAHVLRPIGGPMPLEWRTEWEELQP